ncbi:hypothetical protein PpBr36_03770 [Pyricularia pennisetigena]|uniref:hypothetical protein n=1 Tax=Pyricularia pennisetigena TaxID=1578925 RepID=UPI00114DFADC|nr:hypothetical protein PpBr36_03770 [Pyricularia pennisetigena]TLS30316.1 hypothetical protein PpBr36_03770 [Pyricularia pennisetigena]
MASDIDKTDTNRSLDIPVQTSKRKHDEVEDDGEELSAPKNHAQQDSDPDAGPEDIAEDWRPGALMPEYYKMDKREARRLINTYLSDIEKKYKSRTPQPKLEDENDFSQSDSCAALVAFSRDAYEHLCENLNDNTSDYNLQSRYEIRHDFGNIPICKFDKVPFLFWLAGDDLRSAELSGELGNVLPYLLRLVFIIRIKVVTSTAYEIPLTEIDNLNWREILAKPETDKLVVVSLQKLAKLIRNGLLRRIYKEARIPTENWAQNWAGILIPKTFKDMFDDDLSISRPEPDAYFDKLRQRFETSTAEKTAQETARETADRLFRLKMNNPYAIAMRHDLPDGPNYDMVNDSSPLVVRQKAYACTVFEGDQDWVEESTELQEVRAEQDNKESALLIEARDILFTWLVICNRKSPKELADTKQSAGLLREVAKMTPTHQMNPKTAFELLALLRRKEFTGKMADYMANLSKIPAWAELNRPTNQSKSWFSKRTSTQTDSNQMTFVKSVAENKSLPPLPIKADISSLYKLHLCAIACRAVTLCRENKYDTVEALGNARLYDLILEGGPGQRRFADWGLESYRRFFNYGVHFSSEFINPTKTEECHLFEEWCIKNADNRDGLFSSFDLRFFGRQFDESGRRETPGPVEFIRPAHNKAANTKPVTKDRIAGKTSRPDKTNGAGSLQDADKSKNASPDGDNTHQNMSDADNKTINNITDAVRHKLGSKTRKILALKAEVSQLKEENSQVQQLRLD